MTILHEAAEAALRHLEEEATLFDDDCGDAGCPECHARRELDQTISTLRSALVVPMSDTDRCYEELRDVIDEGSESMTHEDALASVRHWIEENRRLRDAAEWALEALDLSDALIRHQFNGPRPAMDAMHRAAQACGPAMKALREVLL